jgi:hypothetical protein
MSFWLKIISWLTGGFLDRILQTYDKTIDQKTEREKTVHETARVIVKADAEKANSRQWFFPLFFLIPAGLWFSAVCIYSILWCQDCAFPQGWTIAALPAPLNDWMGWIVSSLFIGKITEGIVERFKK